MSLVLGLGLEHSCSWPQECLSSERLSLASDFFCVLGLGLEPCVLDSISGFQSLRAVSAHSQKVSAHLQWSCQRAKNFQPVQYFFNSQSSLRRVVLHSPWVRSAFAIKLAATALRLRCEPTKYAVRLGRMHGDCPANNITYNGNDEVDCFVINFILRNNEWWKGNGKINDSLNVSYLEKIGSKTEILLPEATNH